jgi:hypothetical protein
VSTYDFQDRQVAVEVAWCPACHDDRTVEVVTLDGDPCPVAVCVECGLGVETWLPGLLADSLAAIRPGGGVARAS